MVRAGLTSLQLPSLQWLACKAFFRDITGMDADIGVNAARENMPDKSICSRLRTSPDGWPSHLQNTTIFSTCNSELSHYNIIRHCLLPTIYIPFSRVMLIENEHIYFIFCKTLQIRFSSELMPLPFCKRQMTCHGINERDFA